jgi:predicted lysophospholipase L1 biosynthesis ABC-type transport system permease subunit
VRGRDLGDADVQDAPYVAVVSESFAQRYWPGQDPIGKRVEYAQAERTIVGVVGDVRVRGLEQSSEPQAYLSHQQVRDSAIIAYPPKELVVRATLPPASLLPAIRRAVAAADPEQPISDVATLPEIVGAETAPRVTQLRLLGVLSAIALLIAGVGIHGLLAFMVSRRAHELAVRRALGAGTRGIVRLVLGEGMLLAGAGMIAGLLLAYPAARAMGALLAGVTPADPLTLGGVAALCLVTALLGCLRPALSASRVDPTVALRAD